MKELSTVHFMYNVKCKMVDGLSPESLTVVLLKVLLFPNKILFLLFPFHYIDYDATRKKDEASYEYYIHYEPLNRRNDEWVPYKRIKKLGEKIIEEDPKKKGVKKNEEKKDDKYS